MSVVAWDGRTLAADRQATHCGRRIRVDKIFRLPDGTLLGFVGDHECGLILCHWYQSGRDPAQWPKFQTHEDFSTLIVVERRKVFQYQAEPFKQPLTGEKFYAWGEGAPYALTAMEMGADAEKAVEQAIRFSIYCGLGVTVFATPTV